MNESASRYINSMDEAVGDRLTAKRSLYSGKAGHRRFAHECGYALNDFPEGERDEVIDSMYDVYTSHCSPILDFEEWKTLMLSQVRK